MELKWVIPVSGAKETAMVESSTSRTMAFGVGGLAIVFLVAALTWTVVHQIEYQGQRDYTWVSGTWPMVSVIWPLAIGLIVGGFRVMRRAPSLGAFLVAAASAAAGRDSRIGLRDQARTLVAAARTKQG